MLELRDEPCEVACAFRLGRLNPVAVRDVSFDQRVLVHQRYEARQHQSQALRRFVTLPIDLDISRVILGEPAREAIAVMGVQGRPGDAGILNVIEGDWVSARRQQRGDALAESIEQVISRCECGAVLRIGADKEQRFVKADERIGIVEFAPIDFTKQGFDTRAACAEVALRFIEFVKQLIERFSGHSFWFLVPGFWFLVGLQERS